MSLLQDDGSAGPSSSPWMVGRQLNRLSHHLSVRRVGFGQWLRLPSRPSIPPKSKCRAGPSVQAS